MKKLPVYFKDHGSFYEVRIADIIQLLSASKDLITDSITLDISNSSSGYKIVATGLNAGFWHVSREGSATSTNFYVQPGKNTLQVQLTEGRYRLVSGRSYNGIYTEEPNGKPYILK